MTPTAKKDIVTVIPARGGSKGIPKKNIALLNGKPLLLYTIEAALEADISSGIYVSTDSDEIAEVAVHCGAQVIRRPADISHDTASTESALIHAVEIIKTGGGQTPEYVLTLPPTSPLRKATTIRSFVAYYMSMKNRFDAMLSLTETRHDLWIWREHAFRRLFPDESRRRQDRTPIYLENSAIYITKTEALIMTNSILGRACNGYIIDPLEAIDINEPIDLLWADFILKHSGKSKG